MPHGLANKVSLNLLVVIFANKLQLPGIPHWWTKLHCHTNPTLRANLTLRVTALEWRLPDVQHGFMPETLGQEWRNQHDWGQTGCWSDLGDWMVLLTKYLLANGPRWSQPASQVQRGVSMAIDFIRTGPGG